MKLQKATRRPDGSYVPWSILGDGANYEHLESGGGSDNQSGSVSVRARIVCTLQT